jgi:hypothetical protein
MKRFVLIGVCVSALTACHVENDFYEPNYQSMQEVHIDTHRHRHHNHRYHEVIRPEVRQESRHYHGHPGAQSAYPAQENTTIIAPNPSPYEQQIPQNNVHRHP